MPSDEPFLSNLGRAFREFWLLLRRRPVEDRGWRNFWILWIPSVLPFFVVLFVVDPPFFSVTMLVALIGVAVWSLLCSRLLARLGVVELRDRDRSSPDGS